MFHGENMAVPLGWWTLAVDYMGWFLRGPHPKVPPFSQWMLGIFSRQAIYMPTASFIEISSIGCPDGVCPPTENGTLDIPGLGDSFLEHPHF